MPITEKRLRDLQARQVKKKEDKLNSQRVSRGTNQRQLSNNAINIAPNDSVQADRADRLKDVRESVNKSNNRRLDNLTVSPSGLSNNEDVRRERFEGQRSSTFDSNFLDQQRARENAENDRERSRNDFVVAQTAPLIKLREDLRRGLQQRIERRTTGITDPNIRASIRDEEEARIKGRGEQIDEDLLATSNAAKKEFDEKERKRNLDAKKEGVEASELQRREDQEIEKTEGIEAIIAEGEARGEIISSTKAEAIFEARNKFDAKGETEKELGRKVDAILEGVEDPGIEQFENLQSITSNIDDSYKALKSRVGDAKADEIKNEYLKKKGYDEETIAQENYASLVSDLYSGEDDSALSLAKLVKDGEKLGLPEEFIASQLEIISGSESSGATTKILAETYLKSLNKSEDRDIRSIDGNLVEVTPDGVKELYKSGGDVDETLLFENATRAEQKQVTQIIRQLPTKLKDSELEVAARQNEILADLREDRDVQDILDELNGFLILDDEDLPLASSLRVYATGSDADLADVSAALNRGAPLQAITTVENAKLGKYDGQDFDQAQTALLVQKADEVVQLIDEVGDDFLGKIDSKLFSADAAIRQRAIEDAGIKNGDAKFASAVQLGSILARLTAVERKSFGGTALTETEAKALAPLIADLTDQPASAAVKITELADTALKRHNLYRQKEGLPVFTNRAQLLNNDDKLDLYQRNAEEGFGRQEFTGDQKALFQELTDEELLEFKRKNPTTFNRLVNEFKPEDGSGGTDVSEIKDFDRVNTVIGSGTATGIEQGSSANPDGFDIVIDGGRGAPVKSPFNGKVVKVVSGFENKTGKPLPNGFDQNSGWGNQVIIELENGDKVSINHLDSVEDIKEGQEIGQGVVIGKQGNTGNTLGRTGIHVDITMEDADKNRYDSKHVASLMRTTKG